MGDDDAGRPRALSGEAETPGRREIDATEHAHDHGRGARLQSLFERPQNVGRSGGLDQQDACGIEPQGCEAAPMEVAYVSTGRRCPAADHGPGEAFGLGQSLAAANGEPQSKSECPRLACSSTRPWHGGRLDLVKAERVETDAVDRTLLDAERPWRALRCHAGALEPLHVLFERPHLGAQICDPIASSVLDMPRSMVRNQSPLRAKGVPVENICPHRRRIWTRAGVVRVIRVVSGGGMGVRQMIHDKSL